MKISRVEISLPLSSIKQLFPSGKLFKSLCNVLAGFLSLILFIILFTSEKSRAIGGPDIYEKTGNAEKVLSAFDILSGNKHPFHPSISLSESDINRIVNPRLFSNGLVSLTYGSALFGSNA